MSRKTVGWSLAVIVAVVMGAGAASADKDWPALTPEEELGRLLFFETALSDPPGQACVDCHEPEAAFADPELGLPVSRGVHPDRFGNRNDQPVAYAKFAPPLHKDPEEDIWVGGLFWDGRANTLEEQAQGPPLNPLEMANADTASVAAKVRALPYADRFGSVYGRDALATDAGAFDVMAKAIAAFERTERFSPFSSKYDHFLRGEAVLTEQEMRGLALFVAENKGNCAACHPHLPAPDGTPPLFTDFTYDNLGTPRNGELPFYALGADLNPDGYAWTDLGLGVTVNDPAENGKFRVPTLRNVAITPPYLHNGVFKSLFGVTSFYNTRDVAPWPAPEVAAGVNKEELGNLGLTVNEVDDIVAFMGTLTDGWGEEDDD